MTSPDRPPLVARAEAGSTIGFGNVMRCSIRIVEKSLGEVRYGPCPREEKSRILRRLLFAVKDIPASTPLQWDGLE